MSNIRDKRQANLVLVTRAGAAGLSLARRLEVAGWQAIHCPPIELAGPENPADCAAHLAAALPVDRLVLTSPEGVRQTLAMLPAERFGSTPVVVPGPGTADIARKLGLANVVSPAQSGDSEAMLALAELSAVAGLRILILAAAGGRRLLETELRRRGARVERLHVYRRLECALPDNLEQALREAPSVATLISSGGALQALQGALPKDSWEQLRKGLLIVPSPRVARLARELGAGRVYCAAGAGDQAMIDALQEATSGDQLS